MLLANCPLSLLLRRSTPTRDTVFGAPSQESTMKSRCCTFYKNTSESTSLCKLDTDGSPPSLCPATASLDGQLTQSTNSCVPTAGLGIPLSTGGGRRAPSLWTVPPSFTSQAGGLPLLGCSSSSSPPAWLLMLFLLLLPLSWGSMDSGLSPEAEVCVHLSLPHPFPPLPHLLPARTQCLCWKRKSRISKLP